MRARALALLTAALLSWPSATADWLQPGHDAARTGATPDDGPAWRDVALERRLPSERRAVPTPGFAPVILGDRAYVMSRAGDSGVEGLTNLLHEVSLQTGMVRDVAQFHSQQGALGIASNGVFIFVATDEVLHAFDPEAGRIAWQAPLRITQAPEAPPAQPASALVAEQTCPAVAAEGPRVVVACLKWFGLTGASAFVADFDAATGTPLGAPIVRDLLVDTDPAAPEVPDTVFQVVDPRRPEASLSEIMGIATDGRYAAVTLDLHMLRGRDPTVDTGFQLGRLWVVDLATPDGPDRPSSGNVWMREFDTEYGGPEVYPSTDAFNELSPPMVMADRVLVKHRHAHSFRLADGQDEQRSNDLRDGVTWDGDRGAGFAVAHGSLYAGFSDTFYRLDPNLQAQWKFTLPPGEVWVGTPIVAGDSVYAASQGTFSLRETVWRLDATTGGARFDFPLPLSGPVQLGISNGTLVVAGSDGYLAILGQRPFSMRPEVDVSSSYPGVGETVRLQVRATGGLAPAAGYQVDWGDGTATLMQPNGTFEHQFGAAIEHSARVTVRNAANQTASVQVVFRVGQPDPSQTPWNAPFSPQYQNQTYFLLGLVATAAAGAFGILRSGRKRRRFHRELRLLETGFAQRQDDVRGCDGFLAERKAAARALFLEKRLEEAHASFLERRVDELRRGLRLGTVEDRLKFLPHGMVVHLQRLLADAHVDQWERDHFLDALARQRDLTAAQKAKARQVVEDWFARDAPAGPKA